MKYILKTKLLILLIIFSSGCTFFTPYGRYYKKAQIAYDNKNYETAIDYTIKSINQKKSYEKSLKLYEKLLPLEINNYHEKINKYSVPGYEENLIIEYESLFKLIDVIKNASISESYLSYIKQDYTNEYNLALENAASLHYEQGLRFMSFKNKKNYKLAYNEFFLSDNYISNYKDSQKYIEECKRNSIFHITFIEFKNNSQKKYNDIASSVSSNLISNLSNNENFNESTDIVDRRNIDTLIEQLKISNSGLVDNPHIELGKIKDIDHIIRGELNRVIINKPKYTSDRVKVTDYDKTTYEKHHQVEAFVLIETYLEIIDIETSEIIHSQTFESEISYVDNWKTNTSGSGNLLLDIALTAIVNQTKEATRKNITSEEILNKATNEINNKMVTYLLNFYK